jgi:hypothetical protein
MNAVSIGAQAATTVGLGPLEQLAKRRLNVTTNAGMAILMMGENTAAAFARDLGRSWKRSI